MRHKQASPVFRLTNLNSRMLWRRALPSCFQYRGGDLRLNLDGSDGVSISQNGRWVLFTQFDQARSELILVENFREGRVSMT